MAQEEGQHMAARGNPEKRAREGVNQLISKGTYEPKGRARHPRAVGSLPEWCSSAGATVGT